MAAATSSKPSPPAPGTQEANDFYRMMDGYFEKLDALGATLAITADHGMKAKHDTEGLPAVISSAAMVIGRTPQDHDMSALSEPLRSHGGLSEQRVPFLLNRPTTNLSPDRILRNFDIIDVALNHVQ